MSIQPPIPEPQSPAAAGELAPRWELEQIAQALRGLQFGEVTVTVQDGLVIQVERTERRRLRPPRRRG